MTLLISSIYIQTIVHVTCLLVLRASSEENLNNTLRDIREEFDFLQTRVVHGQNANFHEWPWQVSLEYNGHHICGGSLVKPSWVLTAAHCFNNLRNVKYWSVVVGRHDIRGKTKFEKRYGVTRIFIHAFYIKTNFINDVALVLMQEPVILSKQVNIIKLPKQGKRVAVGSTCYITGWGLKDGLDKGSAAHVLQEAPLRVARFFHCSLVNNELSSEVKVNEKTMICAGGEGKSGCRGDSGGPLACNERNGWILRGVVSWGHAECSVEFYTVFARVSSFADWIKYITERNTAKGPCAGKSGIICLNGGTQFCNNSKSTCRCRPGFSGINCQNGSGNSVSRPTGTKHVPLQCYACKASNQGNCQYGVSKCFWPNTQCAKIKLGTSIIKTCTSPTVCKNYCSSLRDCKIDCCRSSLCNTSVVAKSSFLIIGIVAIVNGLLKL